MSQLAEFKKVFGALCGLVASAALSLSALQFLSGPVSHDLAIVAAVASALLVPLGVAVAPKNGVKSPPAPETTAVVAAVRQLKQDYEAIVGALSVPLPEFTTAYGQKPPTVVGGTTVSSKLPQNSEAISVTGQPPAVPSN